MDLVVEPAARGQEPQRTWAEGAVGRESAAIAWIHARAGELRPG